MLSMRLLSRNNVPQYAAAVQRLHTSILLFDSSSSSSDSDSDKDNSRKKTKPIVGKKENLQSHEETNERLNSLLSKMITKPKPKTSVNSIKAPIKQKVEKKAKIQPYEDKLIGAAKNVAISLGGDIEKTESELLNKLLTFENDKLLEQEHSTEDKTKSKPVNIKNFITGMSIDRTPQKSDASSKNLDYYPTHQSARSQALMKQFQKLDARRSTDRSQQAFRKYEPAKPANIYGGEPLKIFDVKTASDEVADEPRLTVWETLEKKEFKLALTHPPENIFQEMIMWTEEGKLWKFPIDNEQGLEEERSIHFSEHVFMERHLKDWCPMRGPIRHFMQLVCVGLSKNPYMTVREKQEHIFWYRDYFASKQDLLKEVGAIETEIPPAKEIAA